MSAKCIFVRRDGTQMHSCIGQNTNAFEWAHMHLCSKRIWCITATKGLLNLRNYTRLERRKEECQVARIGKVSLMILLLLLDPLTVTGTNVASRHSTEKIRDEKARKCCNRRNFRVLLSRVRKGLLVPVSELTLLPFSLYNNATTLTP